MAKKIILIVLIVFGLVVRFAALGKVPQGLFSDEVAIGLNAKLIAQEGYDEYGRDHPFAFESFSDYKFPGYIYATALAYKFFGSTVITVRLASFLPGLITIFIIGLIAKELFPKTLTYLYAMAFLTTNPLHIQYSSIAYEANFALMFLSIFLLSVLKIASNKNPKIFLPLGVLSIILGTWTYHAEVIIFPLISLSLFILSFFVRGKTADLKLLRFSTIIYFTACIFATIPFLINHHIDERPISYLIGQKDILLRLNEITSSFVRSFNLEFLFFRGDTFAYRNGLQEYGIFPLVFLLPLALGFLLIIKNFSWKNFPPIFLLSILTITLLPSALSSPVPYATRILPFLIPIVLIGSLGTAYLFDKLLNNKISQILLLCIFIFQELLFVHIFFVHYEKTSRHEFPGVSVQLSQAASGLIQQDKMVYFLNGYSCLPWGNDVLELWYFSKLSNKKMVNWNLQFRSQRIEQNNHAVIFDSMKSPKAEFANVKINLDQEEMATSNSGSYLIRCTTQGQLYDPSSEKLIQKFYMYPEYNLYEVYTLSQKF